jgi:hypothetical protein
MTTRARGPPLTCCRTREPARGLEPQTPDYKTPRVLPHLAPTSNYSRAAGHIDHRQPSG